MNKTFSSPASFRQSLEVRLQALSKEIGMDLERIRRKVAFERFLARLFLTKPYPWLLKGGYALETRLEVARATKDLVDVLLLIKAGLDKKRVSASLKNTFRRCGEMPVPERPPNPPGSWRQSFNQMAAECGLEVDFDGVCSSSIKPIYI